MERSSKLQGKCLDHKTTVTGLIQLHIVSSVLLDRLTRPIQFVWG